MDFAHHLPLAFGFGNLWMLGWLGAAAAPILIHLWNRRRYREVSWAAIEYLLAAVRKNSRRMQLEQWLLLAVRTLLIVLVVLAVAQPFLEQLGLSFVPGQRTLKLIVIDGSYSMGYQPTDKSRFERAKQLATQIVDESPQGDAFLLVLMAAPPAVVVAEPASEPNDFLEEIENLTLVHGGADLPKTLAAIEDLLQQTAASAPARREIYFLTDLGRNSWAPELNEADQQEYRQRLDRLGREASLVVVDLGQPNAENLAVTALTSAQPFVTVGGEVSVNAQIRNFGTQPKLHHLVELLVDGRRAKESYVDVPAGEEVSLAFSHRFEAPGEHTFEVRLANDLLPVDDRRWLAVNVKEAVRVLCVNGKPARGSMTGATDFVALALNPDFSAGSGVIQPEIIGESQLVERDLSRYDCVILCNVAQFTPAEARVLENALKRGAGLVFFLGDQVLPDSYNRVLFDDAEHRVLPARIEALVSEAQYRFDPLGYRHPLVRVFQGREQAGLLTTPVYKYFRLRLPENANAVAALAFDGGDAAIVEEPIHRGRSILIATEGSLSSVDSSSKNPWTTMPTWPSFVPLVQEILALAVSTPTGDRNLTVGQPIAGSLSTAAARASVQVVTPDGGQEAARVTFEGNSEEYAFADTRRSGIYSIATGDKQQLFAVNVDTSESDLTKLGSDELPKPFLAHRQTDLDETEPTSLARRNAIHPLLLYAALGLLFLETFLAWRIGNGAR